MSLIGLARRGAFSLANVSKVAQRVSRKQIQLFSTLEKKELGEEANYFRRQEAERIARDQTMKANLAEILARGDHDEQKQSILEVVG